MRQNRKIKEIHQEKSNQINNCNNDPHTVHQHLHETSRSNQKNKLPTTVIQRENTSYKQQDIQPECLVTQDGGHDQLGSSLLSHSIDNSEFNEV